MACMMPYRAQDGGAALGIEEAGRGGGYGRSIQPRERMARSTGDLFRTSSPVAVGIYVHRIAILHKAELVFSSPMRLAE